MQATVLTITHPSLTNSKALYGLALEAIENTDVLATNDCEPCSSGFSQKVGTVSSARPYAPAEATKLHITNHPNFQTAGH